MQNHRGFDILDPPRVVIFLKNKLVYTDDDYLAFEGVIQATLEKRPARILG